MQRVGSLPLLVGIIVAALIEALLLPTAGSAQVGTKYESYRYLCGHTNDADVAISTCTAVLKYPGNNEDTIESSLGNRGSAYMQKHKWQPCIDDLTEALKHNPSDEDLTDILGVRGICLAYLGHYDLALADFNRALQVSPNQASILYGRGMLEVGKLGQPQQGEADIRRALALDPNAGK